MFAKHAPAMETCARVSAPKLGCQDPMSNMKRVLKAWYVDWQAQIPRWACFTSFLVFGFAPGAELFSLSMSLGRAIILQTPVIPVSVKQTLTSVAPVFV